LRVFGVRFKASRCESWRTKRERALGKGLVPLEERFKIFRNTSKESLCVQIKG
jgi:hypothetical protein